MRKTRLEQETIILFNEEEKHAELTVYSSRLKRRLTQLAQERPEECKLIRESGDGSQDFTVPKKWIKINPTRILSEEERAAIAARFSAENPSV